MHQRPYEKLIAWQESHKLCIWVYQLTKKYPSNERFALVNQMRRSAYSVPTNIAEGNGRRSNKDKAHFLEIALSSLEELHYESRLSFDLKYMTQEEFQKTDGHVHRVSYLLTRLRSSIV